MPSILDECPVIDLRLFNQKCLAKGEAKEWSAFGQRLVELSRVQWRDIRISGKKGLGAEFIPRKRVAFKGMTTVVTSDVEKFLVFRYDGNRAMICLQMDERLVVYWLDRDFKAYDHGS